MEPICINKTTYIKKDYMEICRLIFNKEKKRLRIMNAALVVGFLMGGVYYANAGDMFATFVYFAFGVFCGWTVFRGYYLRAQKMYMLQETAYGAVHEFAAYSDRLTISMGKTKREILYTKISSTVENADFIGISSEEFTMLIDKAGFTLGNSDSFKSIIGR